MGRIKTQQIKRAAFELMDKHSDNFKTDFIENKQILGNHAQIGSKKLRNMVAGYLTRLKKQKAE